MTTRGRLRSTAIRVFADENESKQPVRDLVKPGPTPKNTQLPPKRGLAENSRCGKENLGPAAGAGGKSAGAGVKPFPKAAKPADTVVKPAKKAVDSKSAAAKAQAQAKTDDFVQVLPPSGLEHAVGCKCCRLEEAQDRARDEWDARLILLAPEERYRLLDKGIAAAKAAGDNLSARLAEGVKQVYQRAQREAQERAATALQRQQRAELQLQREAEVAAALDTMALESDLGWQQVDVGVGGIDGIDIGPTAGSDQLAFPGLDGGSDDESH